MKLIFEEQTVPEDRLLREIPYAEGEGTNPEKQVFDFYLPEGNGWPTLIFVHGGSWVRGDKDLEAGGYKVYGNIGAYYAGQGLGVANVNYRLQPEADWSGQVEDVARAVVRIREEVKRLGGDPDRLFLSGHSAGAYLAAQAAVADWPYESFGGRVPLCGVVTVSGAGYDLDDQKTYDLGAKRPIYLNRFGAEGEPGVFAKGASVVEHLDPSDPPFLVFFAEREYKSLRHQARIFYRSLQDAGVKSELLSVPGQGHRRIVLTLSQEDHAMTGQVLDFIRRRSEDCSTARPAR
jgi:acetyl esterase/lipase